MNSDQLRAAGVLCVHNENPTRCVKCARAALPRIAVKAGESFTGISIGKYAHEALIVIPCVFPALNEILTVKSSRYRGKWNDMKVEWQDKVRTFWISAGRPRFLGPVTMEWRFYEPNARRDPDNFIAGARKIIQDALVNCGCIPGDGWKAISPPYIERWEVAKANPRVEISIAQVSEPF